MFKNFKETLENTKQSFCCGICFEDLDKPKKCPYCSIVACEKCFNVILKKLFSSSSLIIFCPACNRRIGRNELIDIKYPKDLKEVIILYNITL